MGTLNDSSAWMQPSTCSRRHARVPAPARVVRVPVPAPAQTGFDITDSLRLTVLAVALAAGMTGCAQAPAGQEVRVEPLYRLAHSDSAQVAGLPAPTVMRQGEVDRKADPKAAVLSQSDLNSRAMLGDPEALHLLGVQLAQQGKMAEGIAAMRLANSKAPGQPRLLNNLGYALHLQGQPEQAQAMFEAALLADPGYDRARQNLALLAPKEAVLAAVPAETAAAVEPVVAVAEQPVATAGQVEPAQAVATLQPVPDAPALATGPITSIDLSLAAAAPANAPAGMDTPEIRPAALPRVAIKGVQIEVFNGNGLVGVCGAMRTWLRERGVDTARLGNVAPYNAQMTQVLYMEGQSKLAREVSRRMPLSSELVEMPAGSLTAPVRVVLGHDVLASSALQALASQRDAHPALKAAAKVNGSNDRLAVPATASTAAVKTKAVSL